jgi:hypothetical protein
MTVLFDAQGLERQRAGWDGFIESSYRLHPTRVIAKIF